MNNYTIWYQYMPGWTGGVSPKNYCFGFENKHNKDYFAKCVQREKTGDLKNQLHMVINVKDLNE